MDQEGRLLPLSTARAARWFPPLASEPYWRRWHGQISHFWNLYSVPWPEREST